MESSLLPYPQEPIPLADLGPDWIPDLAFLSAVEIDPAVVESSESTLQGIFLFEFVLRAWSERFSLQYLKSPVALVDFAAILPSLEPLSAVGGSAATTALRPLRLFRLLRLLRLISVNKGKGVGDAAASEDVKNRSLVEQVTNVAVEFLCVFLIAGELFYDLEYQANPDVSDIGDALYWSFLTLTGIGQPFEAVTAAGRVATVASILTALVVVPLQLANLVGAAKRVEPDDASVKQGATTTTTTPVSGASAGGFANDDDGGWRDGGDVEHGREGRGGRGNTNDTWRLWGDESGNLSRGGGGGGYPGVDDVLAFRVGNGLSVAEEVVEGTASVGGEPRGSRRETAVSRVGFEPRVAAGGLDGGGRTRRSDGRSDASVSVREEGMRLELRDARRRLRAFEEEVDLLRDENARLRERVMKAESVDTKI